MLIPPLPPHPSEPTPGHAGERRSLISRKMTAPEVVSHLIAHKCKDITGIIDLPTFDDNPISHGGFSDVYRGRLLDVARSQVAVKALRLSSLNPDPEHLKHAAQELHTWSKCRHPNIVPLLGLTVFRGRIGMVSPWMSKGALPHYLESTPDADRHDICTQICSGVSYLHQIGVIHGDIKGGNVVVSEEGVPALTDFGNSLLTDATVKLTQRAGQTSGPALTLRWSAPELIAGTSRPTRASDIYALGMTILEVISGEWPYPEKSDATVMFLVSIKKEPPELPRAIPRNYANMTELWRLLLCCWAYEPGDRPHATEITQTMKDIRISIPIGRKTTLRDAIKQLELHGCKDATSLLNLSTFKASPVIGGFNDIHIGALTSGTRVALKRRRIEEPAEITERNEIKRIAHEIYVLSKCDHTNVLPLIGFAVYHDHLAMVSPWFLRGSLMEYLRHNQASANRASLMSQAASGVAYLHERNIVHGNIKGSNILITNNHTVKLAGFGSATQDSYTLQFTATTSNPGITIRWTAPERFQGLTGPTTQADIYSLGMTILV
ncbi:unnamed protein product [Rhizoctonia solani]|uniref:Protein kinase domain-containing protein n=1 Tax=Rhizoctonia solani TaxID=456999 RepID=A0A8H3CZN0_9AGAM|nr:unnamed protein product [Rhizoctonia solani]